MSDTNRAVFLSYASEDAEAVKKICEALRAAGVEVWFDQSELGGGDAWDAKIRRQIQDCALFVPIISANTEARHEGYFRLEWDLAEQRTHLMARGVPFLLPVVIDKTNEARAVVPERFREVQWFKLAGGEPTPDFVARIQRLISQPRRAHVGAEPTAPVAAIHPTAPDRARYDSLPPRDIARRSLWPWVAAAAAIGVVVFLGRPSGTEPAPAKVSSSNTVVERPPIAQAGAPAQTEVQKLIARIWEIYEKQEDGTEADWTLAEDLGAQAVKLEPNNADAWAAYAMARAIVANDAQATEALRRAQRAVRLAPTGIEPRFALANLYRRESTTKVEAERMLRQLVSEVPNDKRILRVLAYTLRAKESGNPTENTAEALSLLERAAAVPGGDPIALIGKASVLRTREQYVEAAQATDEALKLGPIAAGFYWRIQYQLFLSGDAAAARATLEQAPANFWLKEQYIYMASEIWRCSRDARRTLATLALIKTDFIEGGLTFYGPKSFLTGEAHALAGNEAAAQLEWRTALKVVEDRLGRQPNDPGLLYWKVRLLAMTGDVQAAQRELQVYEQLQNPRIASTMDRISSAFPEVAFIYLSIGRKEEVLAGLEKRLVALKNKSSPDPIAIFRNRLRFDPAWDPLRGEPRFQALLK